MDVITRPGTASTADVLRYAAGLLMARDTASCRRIEAKMKAALSRAFHGSGGGIAPASPSAISPIRGDYAALANILAARL